MLFEVEYQLSDRAPEVDIIGPFKGCFYQILLWLINRVAIACKHLKGKGTYKILTRLNQRQITAFLTGVVLLLLIKMVVSVSAKDFIRLHFLSIIVCGKISCK